MQNGIHFISGRPRRRRMTANRKSSDASTAAAAGFNPRNATARILAAVREGRFQLIWNKPPRPNLGAGKSEMGPD
jgi:hypothetical protein